MPLSERQQRWQRLRTLRDAALTLVMAWLRQERLAVAEQYRGFQNDLRFWIAQGEIFHECRDPPPPDIDDCQLMILIKFSKHLHLSLWGNTIEGLRLTEYKFRRGAAVLSSLGLASDMHAIWHSYHTQNWSHWANAIMETAWVFNHAAERSRAQLLAWQGRIRDLEAMLVEPVLKFAQ